MKKFFCFIFCFFLTIGVFAQEALKSIEEEYYDFLSLQGISNRSFLNYRTLNDSVWYLNDENHLWKDNKLSTEFNLFEPKQKKENYFLDGINQNIKLKLYGPEWFNSYNTKSPFGQNDGALWQGRGYNTSFSTGIKLDAYGFSFTIKPSINFSQNKYYEIMKSAMPNEYGYFYGKIDAPQRFGDDSIFAFDWGDSEIRYTWRALTVGFGTEYLWLGPSYMNAVLHSNHAASYPKFDAGLKKTDLIIPKLDWNLGQIEARMWIGKLTESDFFDENPNNNHNQIVGYSLSYAPSFLQGLTLGVNKVCLSRWDDPNHLKYINPFYKQNTVKDENGNAAVYGEDQKASITASWLFEKVGLEIYSEIGIDDFLSDGLAMYGYARFPFHTMVYTVGLKKSLEISEKKELYGLINFEWNNTETSQDYHIWPGSLYNFGFHYQLHQGYTNKGQWLGSGIGYGGNSQYLSFTLFHKKGYGKFYIARNNPDNNYIYFMHKTNPSEMATKYFTAFKANFYTGIDTLYYVIPQFSVKLGFMYNLLINPLYNPGYSYVSSSGQKVYRKYTYLNNFRFEWGIKYNF